MPYKDPAKRAEVKRRYYERNKEQYRENGRIKRRQLRALADAIRVSRGCSCCPEKDPDQLRWVLDGKDDHLTIARMISQRAPMKRIKAELERRDIMCINCMVNNAAIF